MTSRSIDGLHREDTLVYSVAFLFYVVQYFVIIYFNTALGAISESADLLKRTWGENLAGQAGLNIVFGLVYACLFGIVALLASAFRPKD